MGVDADEGINELTEEWLEESMESLYGFYTSNIGGVMVTEDKHSPKGTYKGVDRYKDKGYTFKTSNR